MHDDLVKKYRLINIPILKFSKNLCFLVLFDFFRLKLSRDSRFQRAFTACSCVLKVIALV